MPVNIPLMSFTVWTCSTYYFLFYIKKTVSWKLVRWDISLRGKCDGAGVPTTTARVSRVRRCAALLGVFSRLAELLKSNPILRICGTTTIISVGNPSSCFWPEVPLQLWNYYFVCKSEVPWTASSFPLWCLSADPEQFCDMLLKDRESWLWSLFSANIHTGTRGWKL